VENVVFLVHRELLSIFNLLQEMDIKVHRRLNDGERNDIFVY